MSELYDLIRVAGKLRRDAGELDPPYSTTRIIEVAFPTCVVMGRHLPRRVDEMVTRTPDGPNIVYRRGMSTAQQRFAIGHGLAHLLFDDHTTSCRIGRAGVHFNEQRADDFSAELLVPMFELRKVARWWASKRPHDRDLYLDHVDQLASLFHVPQSVIAQRIRMLERYIRLHG